MVGLFGLGQVNLYFCHMNLKKKKMHLAIGKSCSKLLGVKYINLNSLLISRMRLTQQINTCLIIIKMPILLTKKA